jgi:dihydroneopterin aldolase
MDKIKITDLEVQYRVGVSDEERAQPQRLLLTIEMTLDFTAAIASDRVGKTIDYYAVAQFLLKFGEGRNWKLLERLAANLAEEILREFNPQTVAIEVKKFVIPQAKHVSVSLSRSQRR